MEHFDNTSEDPLIRKRFADSILDILRPLTEAELPILHHGDNASEYSVLSDPFSDLDESYILLDQRKKTPGGHEGDEMLLNQFTPEFRKVYDELMAAKREGEESDIEEHFLVGEGSCESSPEEALLLSEPGEFSPNFKGFIEGMLKKCELKYHLEEKKKKEAQTKKDRRVRRATSDESSGPPDNDSLSGMWRMLDAVSVENGFPISNNFYNLYEDRRFDWLIRDEVPWDQIETSKRKCEQWLKMSHSKP
ncbi:uncharacterized protein LOC129769036 [Toxorhynchites rutilus septentrionalis]|uniref:uncharacterized protein LOC129769036 n=1 Tax=Toxorhynchites rutilus septentrionalis TaxID=329112 RepID=UPI0024787166|nr:uncharacterized protein LOC129769036 [Toxorhynchites rutilus septentrionalis]